MASNALILVNPRSRSGDADLAPALDHLRACGWEFVVETPATQQAMERSIERSCKETDCIIIAGGDGTLNAAARALLACGKPLGILPAGTANDLAHTLGLPRDLAAAARIVTAGRLRAIDLGEVNGTLFFNVAHIGMGSYLTRTLDSRVKRRWGPLAYPRSLLDAYRGQCPFAATVASGEERVSVHTLQIAVGNGRYYGGGAVVAREARIDDGELYLYSIPPQPWWRLAALLPRLWRGTHGDRPEVLLLHGPEIAVETATPMAVTADGEVRAWTPARFTVLPQALCVYTPPHAATH